MKRRPIRIKATVRPNGSIAIRKASVAKTVVKTVRVK